MADLTVAVGSALVAGIALACSMSNAFVCASQQDCGPGTCEATGYCSFPDDTCMSGHRYGTHAGDGLADTCVTEPSPTGTDSSGRPPPMGTASTTPPEIDTGADDGRTSTTDAVVETTTTRGSTSATSLGTDSSTGAPAVRVSEGLLVLYLFDEGADAVVHDQGGVGIPLNLTLQGEGHVWAPDGLAFTDNAIARTLEPATKVIDACMATNEITIEAWVTPQMGAMTGPARIVTLSPDVAQRNVTLAQGLIQDPVAQYVGRIRTSDATGSNNGVPQLETPPLASPVLTHVAYSRSAEGFDRIYVDGAIEVEGVRTGDFSNWMLTTPLACGNELELNRPWLGTMHLAAVYERALSPDEVLQNFAAGF